MKRVWMYLTVCALAVGAQAATVTNASFETPVLGLSNFSYNTVGATWVFSGHTGEASTGSPWFAGSPPDGVQAAFLQLVNGDVANSDNFSESVTGLTVGTSYTFSFAAAERPGYQADPITVLLGGTNLGTFTPTSTAFASFTTLSIAATATSETLEFLAASSTGLSEIDSAIDNVTVNTLGVVGTPEPGTSALLGGGLLALGAILSRRRQRKTL